jgi:transposase
MLGPCKERHAPRLVPVSLEAAVPADHFYRHLEATLDLGFVRDWVQDCYAERGRPSIDPIVFFKLQLVMFFEGVRSERQLMRVVADRLSVRWYVGYDLDEPLPDHSSLTRIRERLGVSVFHRFFTHIVDLCQQAGLVWGTELFFDGTKVRANADIDSLVPRWYVAAKAQLHAPVCGASGPTEVRDAEPARAMPPSPASPVAAPTLPKAAALTSLPFNGTTEAEQQLAAANAATWKLLDTYRLNPDRPPSGTYRRITDVRVSTTDTDAAPLRIGGEPRLGYHDQYVVDGGRARIILAALVTPADVQDNQVMVDVLDRVRFRYRLPVRRVVGDSKYATGENLRHLAERGIRAYMPVVDYEQSSPFFRHADFTYDAATDTYQCPNGVTLTYRGNSYTTRVRAYSAPASACRPCPLRARCTDSKGGRRLNRPFDEAHREQARALQTSPAYQKAIRKRQVWVEPLFGEAKQWHGLRQFRLRGLWKVNSEGLLIAAGQNLKRWLSTMGWGRRHGPAGNRALAFALLLSPGHAPAG